MYLKKGLALLDRDEHLPRQISELASAIGTTFLLDGNRKKGKLHIRRSLIDPTGNSLAQAEWAVQLHGEQCLTRGHLERMPDAAEAQSLHAYNEGKFEECLKLCLEWMKEEPFALRAYEAANSVANILNQYEMADYIAVKGLRHHHKATRLVNGRIFSLASRNCLDQAEELLAHMAAEGEDETALVAEANRGLIAMRRGDYTGGRRHYGNAIAGFKKTGNSRMSRLAEAYFIREALVAHLADAPKLLDEAEKKPEGPFMKDVTYVLSLARQLVTDSEHASLMK